MSDVVSGGASGLARRLNEHYDALAGGGERLPSRLRRAFREAGCDPDRLGLDEIAGIDQLHLGGRGASRSLAALGGLHAGLRVLDLGCGTGGASRLLAAEHGCRVVGLDITAAFVEVAAWLSAATGWREHTRFLCGDAAAVPLPDGAVEVVWCQHALMNMPDPRAVLGECRRVLAPGGRLLLHEVVAGGNASPLALPVPWARSAEASHLRDRETLEACLAEAGFARVALRDVTESALAWRRRHGRRERVVGERAPEAGTPGERVAGERAPGERAPGERAPGERAPGERAPGERAPGERAPGERVVGERASGKEAKLPGPALIFGDDFALMGRNLADNLAADRVRILEGVWRLD